MQEGSSMSRNEMKRARRLAILVGVGSSGPEQKAAGILKMRILKRSSVAADITTEGTQEAVDLEGKADLVFVVGSPRGNGRSRLLMEEFGVRIKVFEPFHCFTWISDDGKLQLVEIAFFTELGEDEKDIKLTEHDEIRWVTKDELERLDISEKERETMIKGFEVMAAGS